MAGAEAVVRVCSPLSGQEYLAAWQKADLTPPMASTLGFELSGFSAGEVEIVCSPNGFHCNPYGTAHGGLAATLLDSATGCAVQSQLAAGTGYATRDAPNEHTIC